MTEQIRWGIIGAGNIATQFASDLVHSETGVLGAVASRSGDRAQQLADGHDGCRVFTDYEELCRAEDIDAVYVATPPGLHRTHAVMALAAGKPVLCEKPFAGTLEDALAIESAARANGTFCMEAMWTQFLPGLRDAVARVESGELGALVHLHVTLGFPRGERAGDAITDPHLGGGALTDLGCYCISMAETFMGQAALGSSHATRSSSGSVRSVSAHLNHAVGTSSFVASHEAEFRNTLELSGTRGRLTIGAPFIGADRIRWKSVKLRSEPVNPAPAGLKAKLRDSAIGPLLKQGRALVSPEDGRQARYSYPGTGLQFQADEVARCIRDGMTESRVRPLSSTLSVMRLIDEIGKTDPDE